MDLNTLLHHHQRALIDGAGCASPEARRWAGLSASFYAEQIARSRGALGRDDPFTWPRGVPACG
jgi:hypothetical protein